MSALTSLLVRDGVVPVRKIEEALQRQVISGGDLPTVLLEMDVLSENALAAYCAALHDVEPVTREQVMTVPQDVVRLVPAEVAITHRMIPLAVRGQALEVAVREPLRAEEVEQLGFLLGYAIIQRLACEVRIAAALAHYFGAELPPRLARLLDRLLKREAGVLPGVASPSTSRLASHASVIPYKSGPSAPPFEGHTRPIGLLAAPERLPRRSPTMRGVGLDEHDHEPALPRTPVASLPDDDEEDAESAPASEPDSWSAAPRPPEPRSARLDSGSTWALPKTPAPAPRPARQSPPLQPIRLLRGPLTIAAGERLLKRASDRDQILEILFSFARQFFDYAALFVVQDDVADGREAWGTGASTEEVRSIVVRLDRPSVFAEARRTRAPQVRRLASTETDRELAAGLRRTNTPMALVMPVAIRQRVVLMLYGDRDGEEFDLGGVMELVRFSSRVVEAFEQLIIRKKRVGYHAPDAETPPPRENPLKAAARSVAETAGRSRPSLEERSRTSGSWHGGRASAVPSVPAAADALPPAVDAVEEAPAIEPPGPEVSSERAPIGGEAAPVSEIVVPPHPPDAPPARVLGIPRRAPPAPPDAAIDLAPAELAPVEAERARSAGEEPEVTFDTAADDDDLGDLDDLDDEELEEPLRPKVEGGYHLQGAPVDVVRAPEPRRSSRPPPPRRGPASSRPPSQGLDAETRSVIVDMGDQVHALVEELVRATTEEQRTELIRALLYLGEAALPVLVQAFPGPLHWDRARSREVPPPPRELSIVARALLAFGERAVPYVASLLGSSHADVRFYAAMLAGELVHPELMDAAAERIYDDDPGVRRLAYLLLPRLAGYRGFTDIRTVIRRTAKLRGKILTRRWQAVDALAALRDAEVVGALVDLLKEDDPELVDHVHRALVVLTCTDPGRSHRRWRNWHEKHGEQHRIEWLIDALVQGDEPLRALASSELERLTQEHYGFQPNAPKKDRERVQRRYREWWQDEGRQRFA